MEYYEVIHNSSEITTVGELLRKPSSIFFDIKIEEFLAFALKDGYSNLQRIESLYDPDEILFILDRPYDQFLLKIGTILVIPKERATKTALFLEGGIKTKAVRDIVFKSEALRKLELDPGYKRTKFALDYHNDTLTSEYPDISIWMWCRSLSNPNSPNLTGQVIDISPFVQAVTTNVAGDTGGNFSITLPPISCIQDKNGIWSIAEDSVSFFKNQDNRINYIANVSVTDKSKYGYTDVKTDSFLFHTIIKANDVVFIRFETLKMEERDRITSDLKIALSEAVLPGKIYDMIGLVDSNNQQINFGALNITTTITGRDLTKILIEDGSYFFPTEYAGVGIDVNSATQDRITLRLPNTGALFFFTAFQSPSIEDCLKFVLNNLTSVKIVPDSLFEHYKENLSFQGVESKESQLEKRLKIQSTLEAECLNLIETIRRNRQLSYSLEEQAMVSSLFQILTTYVSRAYAEKLAVAGLGIIPPFTDSGKQVKKTNEIPTLIFYDLFVLDETGTYYRLDNLDTELLLKVIDYIVIVFEIVEEKKVERSLSKSSGIMSIINLNIDPSVADRQVVDSSLATANGSILNYIRKICQRPFVEFFGDTYGDQYHFTVRKPPFDRNSYAYLVGFDQVQSDQMEAVLAKDIRKNDVFKNVISVSVEIGLNTLATIERGEVLSESLSMNDSEVYTWYQISPKNLQFGQGNDMTMVYLPIKGFQEYIDIWGNKPYQVQHNYSPYNPNLLQENPALLSEIEKQTYYDLMYMIESTAYLPFTRKGTITIAGGNRLLKKGNFLQYYNDEMFYIEGVQQNFSISDTGVINRSTTVQVSRGMMQNFLRGVKKDGVLYSYFDIINTHIDVSQTETLSRVENKEIVKREIIEALADIPGLTLKDQPSTTVKKVSKRLVDLIKSVEEGFKPSPYKDGSYFTKSGQRVSYYTIGYGHQILSFEKSRYVLGYKMGRPEAEVLLMQDISEREYIVNNTFRNLNQNQFDAIFDFVYNTCKTLAGFNGKQFSGFKKAIQTYLSAPNIANLISLRRVWLNQSITSDGRESLVLIQRRKRQFDKFSNEKQPIQGPTFVPVSDEVLVKTQITNETTTVTYQGIDRKKILSNLRVNPEVFNFFLRGEQFGDAIYRNKNKINGNI